MTLWGQPKLPQSSVSWRCIYLCAPTSPAFLLGFYTAGPSKIKQKHIPLLSLSLCTETSSSPHGTRLSQPVIAMLQTTPMPFFCLMALCQRSRTACCAGSWHCSSHMCKQNASSSPPVFISHHCCAQIVLQTNYNYIAIRNSQSFTTASTFQVVLLHKECQSFHIWDWNAKEKQGNSSCSKPNPLSCNYLTLCLKIKPTHTES